MRSQSLSCLASALAFCLDVANGAPTSVFTNVVDLGYSTFRGTVVNGNVTQYLAIPYAAAPIGDLRWRAPADPPQTFGIQNATVLGPICWATNIAYGTAGYSEDCLTVNVFTPSTPVLTGSNKNGYPVLLSIPGGAYVSLANANYNGTGLVQASNNNMVVVTMNYRVGVYGFLSSAQLGGNNGDYNVGLLDQRKAFEWVQKYISNFGGDPARVTINGASAGAGSVAHHLAAYGGRNDNLFSAVIAESLYAPWLPTITQTEYQFVRLAQLTGCTYTFNQPACLRNLNVSILQAANLVLPYPGRLASFDGLGYWGPVIDGDLIRSTLYDAFASGAFFTVPAIVGDDTDEGTLFASNAYSATDLATNSLNLFPELSTANAAKIPLTYPVNTTGPNAGKGPWFPALSKAIGESLFICPGNTITTALVNHGGLQTTWNYRWDVQSAVATQLGLGAFHTEENFAVWGTSNVASFSAQAPYFVSQALVAQMQAYWVNFVTNHNPNPLVESGQPKWNTYARKQARLLIQSNRTAMETVPNAQNKRCNFWFGLQNELNQ